MPMGRIPETLIPPADPCATQALGGAPLEIPAPPARVGRYQLVRQLAGGGMGVVFEAIQDEPSRSVALKFMRIGLGSAEALQRFHDESQLLARLHHPAIAQIFDAGTHEHHGCAIPYFVMELVPGAMPITEYARTHRLTLARRIELMIQVCHAVHYGHGRGIVHRDLKPANIVVDTAGNPRVIDFGIAQSAENATTVVTHQPRGTSQVIGTVPYMSPEQCRPESGNVDARSDVYSLGVVLYELLCGCLPYQFATADLDQATRIICNSPPTRPSLAQAALRGDLERVLLKALAKNREDRYPSAAAVADDLASGLRNEPIADRRTTLLGRCSSRIRRIAVQRIWLLGTLCTLLGVLVAQFAAIPAIFRWTPINHAFERWITTRPLTVAAEPALSDMRIIAMTPQTDFDRLGEALGIEGIDARNNVSLRRMHGRLMQSLALGRPKVVVFDIAFPGDTEFDKDFAAGAEALRAVNCDVLVGSHTWTPTAPGPGRISTEIAAATRWGGLSAGTGPDAPWRIHLARVAPDGQVLPSLALATLAASRAPGSTPVVAIDPIWNTLQIRHARVLPGGSVDIDAGETRPFTGVERVGGTIMASLMIQLPSDAELSAVTSDYGRVGTMSQAELRRAFEGRVVLIGDARPIGRDGPFQSPDGRELPGFIAQAAAIDALLRQAVIRHPAGIEVVLIELLSAGAGAVLVLATGGRWRSFAAVAALAAAIVGGSVVAYAGTQYLFNPLIAIVAGVVAGAAMAWGVRARARTALWFSRSIA